MANPIPTLLLCVYLCACAPNRQPAVIDATAADSSVAGAKSLFLGDGGITESSENVDLAATVKPAQKLHTAVKPKTKPTAKPAATHKRGYSGLSYWIERQNSSGMQRVTSSTTFLSGDRVRLHIKSNHNGYLYVVAQGTSGHSDYLFPASANDSEYVEANKTYTVPANDGFIRFDNRPGREVLWLFLSRDPLPPTQQASAAGPDAAAAPESGKPCGSKDLLIEAPGNVDKDCGIGSKDLMLENDSAPSTTTLIASQFTPAEYVVAPSELIKQGRVMSLKVVLRHD